MPRCSYTIAAQSRSYTKSRIAAASCKRQMGKVFDLRSPVSNLRNCESELRAEPGAEF
jgi:hypothetical protein